MLKITLLYGYNCSYAVLQRVQCKEYNLQFMLLCNSCIYFAHAIKIVWYIVIFSSHNTLVFRRFAISDYMVTTAAYDDIRNESDHGGDPTGLFTNITVHKLVSLDALLLNKVHFFSRWTRYPVWNWRCPRRARDPHLASIVLVVLRQKPSKNDPWQKLYCALLEMDWK